MGSQASLSGDCLVNSKPIITDDITDKKTNEKKSTDSLIKVIAKKVFEFFKGIYDFIYAKNPVTQKRQFWFIPASIEKLTGSWMYSYYVHDKGGKTFNNESSDLIKEIGQKLSKKTKRGLDWEFTQVRSNKINAFCLPGGKICIYDGIIEGIDKVKIDGYEDITKEEKIAAVLSHEIIHAEARHSARKIEKLFVLYVILTCIKVSSEIFLSIYKTNKKAKTDKIYSEISNFVTSHVTKWFTKLYILVGSRSQEYEADKYGMHLMKNAGYNPKAALWLQEFFVTRDLEASNWIKRIFEIFSTHPTPKNRLEKNKETLKELESSN